MKVTLRAESTNTTSVNSFTLSQSVSPGASFGFLTSFSDNDDYTLTLTAELLSDPSISSATTSPLSVSNLPPAFDNFNWSHPVTTPTPPALPFVEVKLGDMMGFGFTTDLDDPGSFDSLNLTVDWDDSSSSSTSTTSGNFPYSPGSSASDYHQYGSADTYTVTVTLTDDDGGTVTKQVSVNVVEDPPVLSGISVQSTSKEGYPDPSTSTGTMTTGNAVNVSGTVTDQFNDLSSLKIQWGDGKTETFGAVSSGTFSYGHSYGDDGNYTITLTAEDWHGAQSVPATASVALNNVAPVACIGTSMSCGATGSTTTSSSVWTVDVGEVVTLDVWAQERGWDDSLTITADWGGSGATPMGDPTQLTGSADPGVSGSFAVSGTLRFIYGQAGHFTVAMTAADDNGATDTNTTQIRVKPKSC